MFFVSCSDVIWRLYQLHNGLVDVMKKVQSEVFLKVYELTNGYSKLQWVFPKLMKWLLKLQKHIIKEYSFEGQCNTFNEPLLWKTTFEN